MNSLENQSTHGALLPRANVTFRAYQGRAGGRGGGPGHGSSPPGRALGKLCSLPSALRPTLWQLLDTPFSLATSHHQPPASAASHTAYLPVCWRLGKTSTFT